MLNWVMNLSCSCSYRARMACAVSFRFTSSISLADVIVVKSSLNVCLSSSSLSRACCFSLFVSLLSVAVMVRLVSSWSYCGQSS